MKSFFGPLDRGTLNVNNCNDSLLDVGTHVLYWAGDVCNLFLKDMIISFPITDLIYWDMFSNTLKIKIHIKNTFKRSEKSTI